MLTAHSFVLVRLNPSCVSECTLFSLLSRSGAVAVSTFSACERTDWRGYRQNCHRQRNCTCSMFLEIGLLGNTITSLRLLISWWQERENIPLSPKKSGAWSYLRITLYMSFTRLLIVGLVVVTVSVFILIPALSSEKATEMPAAWLTHTCVLLSVWRVSYPFTLSKRYQSSPP